MRTCDRCGALITGDLFHDRKLGWLGQCCVVPTGDGTFLLRERKGTA